MTTTTLSSKTEILAAAKEMTAANFLLEFDQLVAIDEMENLLDANEGMVNLSVTIKENRKVKELYILFVDGKFDSYAY